MHDADAVSHPSTRFDDAVAAPPIADALDSIVFAIDFGAASLGAARWAVSHLARRHAPALVSSAASVVHVVPWPTDVQPGEVSSDDVAVVQRLRPALVGGLAGVAASLGLEGARPVLRIGRPSTVLGAIVDAERARLLVLGRRRNSARSRVGEPNVIERVARRAACDVLVVPEGAPGPVEHVVAAVDASPWAATVVARAADLARAHGAALTLVHVLAPSHGSYDRVMRTRADEPGEEGPRPARDLVVYQDAAYGWLASLARAADPATTCRLAIPVGDAAREIAGFAARRGPSLVVLGKRGADEAPAGSLGSVARELLLRGSVSVLALDGPPAS
jgi:nucleotide-binding universal stress UspA family protein